MKTYTGGCHCGALRYEADVALDGAMSCNCSYCGKKGFLLTFVAPAAFRIIAGKESDLTEYLFNKKHINHLFCPTCGVQSYGRGKGMDGTEMIALNVRCLDDVDPETLTITKFDGKSL